ncbi:unnamed protein product [Prunus armeniaca]
MELGRMELGSRWKQGFARARLGLLEVTAGTIESFGKARPGFEWVLRPDVCVAERVAGLLGWSGRICWRIRPDKFERGRSDCDRTLARNCGRELEY